MRSGARILVVDDSPTIRRVVAGVLRQSGYDVSTAESGETGLAEAQAVQPDLILLDFMMPGMNGYQFVKALDGVDQGKAPVVLMVTRTDQVPEGALKSLGVVDTITKPFSPDAILAVTGHCLEKHAPQRRQETTRVTAMAQKARVSLDRDVSAEGEVTLPGLPGGRATASTEDDRLRADHALKDIARLLAESLIARGVDDASALAASVAADLRAGLSSHRLADSARMPQPSLSGDLAAVPLPEVLQLLKFQGQTGVLDVLLEDTTLKAQPTDAVFHTPKHSSGPARVEVGVKQGVIVSVRARDARSDLLLGHYFVGGGLVSPAQLEAILQPGPGPDPRPLGQRLVEAGLVTTEQLRRCVGAQAQDLMVELLRARRGFFALRRGDHHLPSAQVHPGFSIDMLLFEALRRIDEWSVFETAVPSFDARFVLVSDDLSDLTPDEIDALSVFRRERPLSVHDLLQRASLRAFDGAKLLYRLCALQRIRRIDDGSSEGLVGDA